MSRPEPSALPAKTAAATPVELTGVSVFYGEVVGLSNVSLKLAPGITGIVGPNGCGKTTLMRALVGLLAPSEGRLDVLGGNPFSDASVRARIAFVPASECFYEGSGAQKNLEVAFLAKGNAPAVARERAVRALELVRLTESAGRRYGNLSRGMRQRIKLGLALETESPLVLLDEPFLGVDPPNRKLLREHIMEMGRRGCTVLVSSHVLHEVESITDRVGVLAHGRLLGFGTVGELLRELRDRHPHRIHVATAAGRRLAAELVTLPHVRAVQLEAEGLEFITDRPDLAYRELPALVVRSGAPVKRLETRDNGLAAVFEHVTAAGSRRL